MKTDGQYRERLIDLPRIADRRGNLSIVEARKQVPFDIARAYWIYDVPGGQRRGSHAFRRQHELIVALSGSFDVVLDDGKECRSYTLNRAYQALYIPNMLWRNLVNFSTNAVCLVLSSEPYDENDYIRNYRAYKREVRFFGNCPLPLPDLKENKIRSSEKEGYYTIDDCSLIDLSVIRNRAGNITPVHGGKDIPFPIERVFFIYDIPCASKRGMHAHKHCHEILVATSGSFEVELDDGTDKKTITLNRPMSALYIPPGIWATEKSYSSGAVCLALASEPYDDEDYIQTYVEFKKYRQHENRVIPGGI